MPSAAPADSVVRKSTPADLLFLLALAITARLLFLRLQNPKAVSFDLWVDVLGAFLVRRYPTETLVRISRLLESTKFVTALRAPLFVAYLVVLAAGVRELAAGSPHKRAPREL